MSQFGQDINVEEAFLQAGEILMTDRPTRVTTVLGSCVSVCLFDPVTLAGAACHAVMPNAPVALHHDPFRYADEAVLYLIERYRRMGVAPDRLVVKVFGGADVLGKPVKGYASIGRQNTMAALETLGWQGLRITAQDTGGHRGRKIAFLTHTGEVLMRYLNPTSSRTVARREKARG